MNEWQQILNSYRQPDTTAEDPGSDDGGVKGNETAEDGISPYRPTDDDSTEDDRSERGRTRRSMNLDLIDRFDCDDDGVPMLEAVNVKPDRMVAFLEHVQKPCVRCYLASSGYMCCAYGFMG